MNNEEKISIIIHTYNAEKHLEKVLDAVRGFDEVIVCDMESTDSTLSIAERYGCRVITFPKGNHTIPEPARDFAIHHASNKWVLVVDADEIVTPELRDYLYSRIKKEDCPAGLYIPRQNMFMGHFIKGFNRDYQLRFFVEQGTYWPPYIHTFPTVQGRVERVPKSCKNVKILHLADMPLSQFIAKINLYTTDELDKNAEKNYGFGALLWRPFWRFFRTYVLQGSFRNGLRGFIQACYSGIYQFMAVSKAIEKRMREADDHKAL